MQGHSKLLITAALTGAVGFAQAQPDAGAAAGREYRPVTEAMLANPPAEDWLSFRRTLNAWGYSPLREIDTDNVALLEAAWSTELSGFMMEATPLVHDGIMYVPLPADSILALDAATGEQLWSFAREYPGGAQPGGTKRNIAIFEDRLISTSSDGVVFAVDAQTGEQAWEVRLTGPANTSSGPIIAGGKVISGRACAPNAGPEGCVMIANDARTGKELWRTWTIARPGEAGDESWGGVPWEERNQVGTWMPASYDPELNLVYFGTSVTGPTPKYQLGGNDKQHLYHTSTLALDADTGEIVWYYQHIIDHWDFDHPFERILIDTIVVPDADSVAWMKPGILPGEARPVITGIPGKTGIVYTLDRRTGEFLWATPTVRQNVVETIDGSSGEVTMNPATVFTADGQTLDICPAFTGGKNWMPGSYSPRTGLMYMPLQNLCSTVTSTAPGEGQLGMRINYEAVISPGETEVGLVQAISVATGRSRWVHSQVPGTMSLVATAGNLVFFGDVAGGFRALDAETGAVLWETQLSAPVSGIPISYGAGGKQYVAVATGMSPEANGLRRMTPGIDTGTDTILHVFALP